jgi:hypothetical protein
MATCPAHAPQWSPVALRLSSAVLGSARSVQQDAMTPIDAEFMRLEFEEVALRGWRRDAAPGAPVIEVGGAVLEEGASIRGAWLELESRQGPRTLVPLEVPAAIKVAGEAGIGVRIVFDGCRPGLQTDGKVPVAAMLLREARTLGIAGRVTPGALVTAQVGSRSAAHIVGAARAGPDGRYVLSALPAVESGSAAAPIAFNLVVEASGFATRVISVMPGVSGAIGLDVQDGPPSVMESIQVARESQARLWSSTRLVTPGAGVGTFRIIEYRSQIGSADSSPVIVDVARDAPVLAPWRAGASIEPDVNAAWSAGRVGAAFFEAQAPEALLVLGNWVGPSLALPVTKPIP